jgi:hypothetical protein
MVALEVLVAAVLGAIALFCMMLLANFLALGVAFYLVSKVLQRKLSGALQAQAQSGSNE